MKMKVDKRGVKLRKSNSEIDICTSACPGIIRTYLKGAGV